MDEKHETLWLSFSSRLTRLGLGTSMAVQPCPRRIRFFDRLHRLGLQWQQRLTHIRVSSNRDQAPAIRCSGQRAMSQDVGTWGLVKRRLFPVL